MFSPAGSSNDPDDEGIRLVSPDLRGRLFRTVIESFRREPDLKSFLNRLSEASFVYLKLCQQTAELAAKGFLDEESASVVLGVTPALTANLLQIGASLREVPDPALLHLSSTFGLISTHLGPTDLEKQLKSSLSDWTVDKAVTLERERREQTVALLLHLLKRRRG